MLSHFLVFFHSSHLEASFYELHEKSPSAIALRLTSVTAGGLTLSILDWSILSNPDVLSHLLVFFHSSHLEASFYELHEKSPSAIALRPKSVTAGGFEPPTLGAEIQYSIQLNYAASVLQS